MSSAPDTNRKRAAGTIRCRKPVIRHSEQLQSCTCRSAGASTSKRTRRQWQPPRWVTRSMAVSLALVALALRVALALVAAVVVVVALATVAVALAIALLVLALVVVAAVALVARRSAAATARVVAALRLAHLSLERMEFRRTGLD